MIKEALRARAMGRTRPNEAIEINRKHDCVFYKIKIGEMLP
jgi:hypothetical protein